MKINQEATIRRFIEEIERENDGSTSEFLIPKILVNKVEGYRGIKDDLVFCQEIIKECLSQKMNKVIRQSCFYAIAITYGKCFTDASSTKAPKLEESDIEDAILLERHRKVMQLRHSYIAHRGNSDSIFNFIYLSVDIKSLKPYICGKQTKLVALPPSDLEELNELIDHLLVKVENKYRKATEKIFKKFLNEFEGSYSKFKIAGPKREKL